MFGRARRSPRRYFGRTKRPPAPAAVTTSRSVVHEPWGSRVTTNVKPFSSIAAGAEAEMFVIRTNVSRSYTEVEAVLIDPGRSTCPSSSVRP